MNPHNNIDDFFKNNLHQSEIPMSGVEDFWSKIDPYKPKKRRTPFLLWFTFFIGLVIVGWTIVNSSFKSQDLNTTQKVETKKSAPTIHNNNNQKVNSTQEGLDKFKNAITKSNLQQIDHNQQIIIKKESNYLEKPSQASSMLHAIPSRRKLKSQNRVPKTLDRSNTNLRRQDATDTNQKSQRNKDLIEGVAYLKRTPIPTKINSSLDRIFQDTPALAAIETFHLIQPIRAKRKWFGDLSLTTSLSSDRINPIDSNSSSLSAQWKSAIDPLASYQLSFAIGKQINERNSITLGIEYQHVESQLKRDTVISNSDVLWHPEAYITSNGFRGDSVLVATSQTGINSSPFRETFMNIPLRYNYLALKKGPFELGISLGFVLNLRRHLSGQKLNLGGEWKNVNDSQNRIGISYDLAIATTYKLTENHAIFLSPRFRYNRSPYLCELPLSFSRFLAGLEMGGRVAF